ncbi:hypothetical protein [Glaesserella sp.]|uniref:hypothetical protein n=1 Tax=Glaesserella sp. TaxID=2094731 RepID=UPI00359FA230
MKISTKFSMSIVATFVLSACGGGSGSSPTAQPISQKVPTESVSPVPAPQSPQATESPQPALPSTPEISSTPNEKEVIPTPPHTDEVIPTPPKDEKHPEIAEDNAKHYTVFGNIVFNQQVPSVTVNEFTTVEDAFDKTRGKPIIQRKTAKEIPLSSITLTGVGTEGKSDYQIHLLTDNVFYGYYANAQRDFTVEAGDRFNEYFAVIDDSRITKSVPLDLTATYRKENGFLYGSNYHVQDFAARITKRGNVDIRFENGKATGSIVDLDFGENETVFEISGDTKQLILEPTESNAIIQAHLHHNQQKFQKGFEKAAMDITFIDSATGADDQKYLIGTARSDMWSGVLAAEKQ